MAFAPLFSVQSPFAQPKQHPDFHDHHDHDSHHEPAATPLHTADPHHAPSAVGGMSLLSHLRAEHAAADPNPLTSPIGATFHSLHAQGQFRTDLAAHASSPGVPELARRAAEQDRAEGDYSGADLIAGASPRFKSAQQTAGEARARRAVQVDSVADRRAQLTSSLEEGRNATLADARHVLAQAHDNPHAKVNGNSAVITKRDHSGNVTSTERVSVGANGEASVETTSYQDRDGRSFAVTTSSNVGADGTLTTTNASYPAAPTRTAAPRFDERAIANDRSGDVTFDRTSLHQDRGSGELTADHVLSKDGTVTGSHSRFWRDDNIGGDDKLKHYFSGNHFDREETRTYTLGPQGPVYTRQRASSQGRGDDAVQETATTTKNLDQPEGLNACYRGYSLGDLDSVRAANKDKEEFDGDDHHPKQWLLEKSLGNDYKSQTFVEGHTDASVITERSAHGSTVDETRSGKWFRSDGKTGDVRGSSTQTFADDGTLASAHSQQFDPDGNATLQNYHRRALAGGGYDTQLGYREIPNGGRPTGFDETRRTDGSGQIVSASDHSITHNGDFLSAIDRNHRVEQVNGEDVINQREYAGLSPSQRADLDRTKAALGQQIADYAQSRGVDLSAGIGAIAQPGASIKDTAAEVGFGRAGLGAIKNQLLGIGIPTTEEGRTARAGARGLAPESGDGQLTFREALDEQANARVLPISLSDRAQAFNSAGSLREGWNEFQSPSAATRGALNGTNPALYGIGSGVLGTGASAFGAIGNGEALRAAIGSGDLQAIATSGLGTSAGAAGVTAGIANTVQGIRAAQGNVLEGDRFTTATNGLNRWAGRLSTAAGYVGGGVELYDGIKSGNGYEVAKGGVTVGGTALAGIAAEAAAGAIGGSEVPVIGNIAGFLAGAGVGAATWAVNKGIDALQDSAHQIADPKI